MVAHSDEILKELLPYESHFISISDSQMHYLDEGSGDVILLIHGNPTWCFYYRNLISKLKDKYRVIAVDLLGCGLSEKNPDKHYKAEDRINHLIDFVNKLNINNFSLVLHDWGGALGTGLAASMPDRINKIVYLNTTLTETESLPFLIKAASSKFSGKFLTKITKQFLRFTTGLGVSKKLPKIIKNAYFLPYKTIKDRTAIWDFVADIPFSNNHPTYKLMLELAKKIDCLKDKQVKIIWGLKDPCFHREMLNNVAAFFPDADILEIPDASHLVLEDANVLVCNTIKDFFINGNPKKEAIYSDNPLIEKLNFFVKNNPEYTAVIEPLFLVDEVRYGLTTYQNIDLLINKYQRGLTSLGLKSGDKVVFLVQPGVDFVALTYAVMKIGATPVFLDPGMGKKLLLEVIEEFKPDAFIGSLKAQFLRFLYKKKFASIKFNLAVCEWFFNNPTTRFFKRYSNRPLVCNHGTNEKMIAFTSGGTGKPKAVVFTNQNLNAQLRIFKDIFKLETGKKDLPLLPIFSLFNLALGVTSVFAPINVAKPLSLSPAKILTLVKDLQINYSFGSPTLWKKIAEYCVRTNNKFNSLEKVFMAGAPVSKKTLELVNEVVIHGTTYTPYGSTECLPMTLVSSNEILENKSESALSGETGVYVGNIIPELDVKIINNNLEVIGDLTIGEIIVAGDNVSKTYFNNEAANQNNKIEIAGKNYHRMGDLGYLSNNKLYFCGRLAHSVKTSNKIYYSIPTENIFNHPLISRVALVDLNGKAGLAIEPLDEFWKLNNKIEFRNELLEIAKSNKISEDLVDFFAYKEFPVDGRHNAKIFRDKLSILAQKGDGKF